MNSQIGIERGLKWLVHLVVVMIVCGSRLTACRRFCQSRRGRDAQGGSLRIILRKQSSRETASKFLKLKCRNYSPKHLSVILAQSRIGRPQIHSNRIFVKQDAFLWKAFFGGNDYAATNTSSACQCLDRRHQTGRFPLALGIPLRIRHSFTP